MIVLAIVGYIFQMKYFKDENEKALEEDEMANEDEAKKCGCF